jgi:hypothetical protein
MRVPRIKTNTKIKRKEVKRYEYKQTKKNVNRKKNERWLTQAI